MKSLCLPVTVLWGAAAFCIVGSVARADVFAIVVGVNECPQFRLPGGSKPRPLRGAENDADAMSDLLRNEYKVPARNLFLLKGKAATRAKMEHAFKEVARRAGRDDLFIFHFSGHGTQLPDRRPLDEDDKLDEALCPFDASETGTGLIRDDELAGWLDAIHVREITVILDCCHAGTGTKDAQNDITPRYLPVPLAEKTAPSKKNAWRELRGQTKSFGRRLTAFFACRSGQQAYERRMLSLKPPQRAGQFTTYLLAGFKARAADANQDGLVSNREALNFAAQSLDRRFNSKRPAEADRQSPLLETDFPNAPVFGIGKIRRQTSIQP